MSGERDGDDVEPEERQGRTAAEWTTFAISIAIILGTVGLATYLYFSNGDEPPIVTATALLDEVRQQDEIFYVPIAVTNSGDRTAEEVTIEAELTSGNEPPEVAEFTLDFLAGGETATGAAVFSSDPAAGELTVDVVSFR